MLHQNICFKKKLIEFCVDFEIVDSQTQCLKCLDSAYLDSNKSCQKRNYSLSMIPNCSSLDQNNDNCASCSDGFDLSSDKHTCLPLTSNCSVQSLATSPSSDEYYKCSQCDEKFSLSSSANICFSPISGCSQYNSIFDKCVSCENLNYFLEGNGVCASRAFKPVNCKEFLPDSEGCQICKESFKLTSDSLECLPSINFCQVINLLF
jgi:hypothetical protein